MDKYQKYFTSKLNSWKMEDIYTNGPENIVNLVNEACIKVSSLDEHNSTKKLPVGFRNGSYETPVKLCIRTIGRIIEEAYENKKVDKHIYEKSLRNLEILENLPKKQIFI